MINQSLSRWAFRGHDESAHSRKIRVFHLCHGAGPQLRLLLRWIRDRLATASCVLALGRVGGRVDEGESGTRVSEEASGWGGGKARALRASGPRLEFPTVTCASFNACDALFARGRCEAKARESALTFRIELRFPGRKGSSREVRSEKDAQRLCLSRSTFLLGL